MERIPKLKCRACQQKMAQTQVSIGTRVLGRYCDDCLRKTGYVGKVGLTFDVFIKGWNLDGTEIA